MKSKHGQPLSAVESANAGSKTFESESHVKLSEKAQQLLNLIPEDGSHVGNTYLRSNLGWTIEEYWKIRQELLNHKLVTTGRGRGGSVGRAVESLVFDVGKAKAAYGLVKEEADLYSPLKKWLGSDWGVAAEEEGDYHWVEVTASPSGRKRESGKWSRPDVTFVQVSTYELIPRPTIEVSSFEVKRYNDALDLSSVYEAASHSRWAHYAYLVVEDSASKSLTPSPRFQQELSRYGVGLLKMSRVDATYQIKEDVEPIRQSPSDADLNEMLEQFFENLDEKQLKRFKNAIGK